MIAANTVLDLMLVLVPPVEMLRVVVRSTCGLVQPVLLTNAVSGVLVVGGLIFCTGRLRWGDVGLSRNKLLPALGLIALAWIILQLWLVGYAVLEGQPLAQHEQWVARPARTAGKMIGCFVGTGLYEETVFRGFLLSQLWVKFNAALGNRSRSALVAALIVSQAVFALGHIPSHWHRGTSAADYPATMLVLFLYGVLFSLVYLRSGNLLVAVGIHGLINAPGTLVASPGEAAELIFLVIVWLVLSTLFRWLRGRRGSGNVGALSGGRSPGR